MHNFFKTLNHFWHKPESKSMDIESEPTRLVSLASLAQYHILRWSDYPCVKCSLFSEKCHKLHFADRTICVIHKNNVNNFKNRNRK